MFPKRLEILKFLARREGTADGTVAPSVGEISRVVGLKSKQTVHHHLLKLEEEGYIGRLADRIRTIKLTQRGWEAAGDLPLLGRVAAGRGLEAIETRDEAYSLMAELLSSRSGKDRYLLRVVGQSMTGAGIEDGDTLLVEEDETPPDGAVIVALLDGGEEVTVKRLYREGERVRLKPENDQEEDILVSAESLRIQGRVVYVVHPPRE